jgi:hypothetical protein
MRLIQILLILGWENAMSTGAGDRLDLLEYN